MAVILERYKGLDIMVIKVIGSKDTAAYMAAVGVVRELGHTVDYGSHFYSDLTIAPLLTQKLTQEELNESIHGVLIFHPSPLPHGRGASAIKWAYSRNEPITAATWLWANDKMDAGDICEMEIVKIDYSMSPRQFYEAHMLPALERTLKRCLNAIAQGYKRKVPQVEAYSTFDYKKMIPLCENCTNGIN